MVALEPLTGLWAAYEAAADSNSLLTDVLTGGCVTTLSDTLAQGTERATRSEAATTHSGAAAARQDLVRTLRFSVFGLADGAASHGWYAGLDAAAGEAQGAAETALKVGADALVYTPVWCAWFLAAMTVLEARGLRAVLPAVRAGLPELYRGNLGFFLPLTGLIYGFVPRDERVLAFGSASLVYTTILSLWSSARAADDGAALEACDVDTAADCLPVPRPPRSVSLLSFGTRRVLVAARRGARRRGS